MSRSLTAPRGIFLKNEEWLCLLAPLALVPLIIWELSLDVKLSAQFLYFAAITSEIILGGAGHSALSWALFSMLPEGRNFMRDRKYPWKNFAIISVVMFLALAALFCLPPPHLAKTAITVFFFIDWCAVYHHSLSQTQGLSFIYSYRLNPDQKFRPLIEKAHRQQKHAFFWLYFFSIAPGLAFILQIPFFASTGFRIFGASVTLALVGFIFYSNFRLPFGQRNKFVFLLRLLLFPLSFFSVLAAVSYRAIHGIEYIFIYRKLFGTSSEQAPRLLLTAITVGLFLAGSTVALFTMSLNDGLGVYFSDISEIPIWFKLLCALSSTRFYMHIYMDRLMFRMRDPASSVWIKPLLNA